MSHKGLGGKTATSNALRPPSAEPASASVDGNYRAEQAEPTAAEPMPGAEFSAALATLGWSRVRAGAELGVPCMKVRQWAGDFRAVPPEVAAWLRPYAAEAAALNARHPPPKRIRHTPLVKERSQ